jgi:hypothetical protein
MMNVERRILSDAATCNLLACGLGEKCRAGQASSRSRGIDLIDEPFIEGDVDPDRATGIAQQRHREQHSTCSQCRLHLFIAQDIIDRTCRRHRSTGALQRFYMLTQRRRSIRRRFRQSIPCRETSFHIRKPDSERAVGVLFDDCYILDRHDRSDPWQPSWSPSGELVDPSHEPDRQILTRMRDRDERLPIRMFERMVIAAHAIQNPTILLQHPDQLAAVSFHVARLVDGGRRETRPQRSSIWRVSVTPSIPASLSRPGDRVYLNTHKINARQVP